MGTKGRRDYWVGCSIAGGLWGVGFVERLASRGSVTTVFAREAVSCDCEDEVERIQSLIQQSHPRALSFPGPDVIELAIGRLFHKTLSPSLEERGLYVQYRDVPFCPRAQNWTSDRHR